MERYKIPTNTVIIQGNNISAVEMSTENTQISKFLDNLTMLKTTNQVKEIVDYTQFFRNHIPNLIEKLMPFYKPMKNVTVIDISWS